MGRVFQSSAINNANHTSGTPILSVAQRTAQNSDHIRSLQNPNLLIDWPTLSPVLEGDRPRWHVFCTWLVERLITLSEGEESGKYFIKPIDPIKLNLPDYFEKVKHPMDLDTMKNKLIYQQYANSEEFRRDFQLICDNCKPTRCPSGLKGKLLPSYLVENFDSVWDNCPREPMKTGEIFELIYKSVGKYKLKFMDLSAGIGKLEPKLHDAAIRMIQLFEHTAGRLVPSKLYFHESGFNAKDLDYYLIEKLWSLIKSPKDKANSLADELETKAREWGFHLFDLEPGFMDFGTQKMVSTGWKQYASQFGFSIADKEDLDEDLLKIYRTNKYRTPLARIIQFGQIRVGDRLQSLGSFRQTGLGMANADEECAMKLIDYLEIIKVDEAKADEMAIEFEEEAKRYGIDQFDKSDRAIPLHFIRRPCRQALQPGRFSGANPTCPADNN